MEPYLAGREALAAADRVLCDRLVPAGIRAMVSGEPRIARKLPGRAAAARDELNLKCGDLFLFGRIAHEVALLRAV
ncbi:MAG: hypothetical protein AAFV53_18420 [Myxococcota bacterium]